MVEKLLKQTEAIINANSSEEVGKLSSILKFSNVSQKEHDLFSELIFGKGCINLHFHPDRILFNNLTVLDGLLASGKYKNQYQTKISSGSLTAYIGGDRYVWENKMFNNFYGENINDRPKYGSLNLTCTSDGASPRFGSCFFVTSPEIKQSATFTYGDSHLLPKEIGTAKNLTQIFSKLYEDIFTRNTALGLKYDSLDAFIKKTTTALESNALTDENTHNLDFYIESQIHGNIDLEKDVTSLVVDYSFRGTEFESKFQELCENYGISLIWNLGYELKTTQIPDNFRGIDTQIFANKIAMNGIINAHVIGKSLTNEKLKLEYKGLELLQLAKYVWHCLVKFGTPIKPPGNIVLPARS